MLYELSKPFGIGIVINYQRGRKQRSMMGDRTPTKLLRYVAFFPLQPAPVTFVEFVLCLGSTATERYSYSKLIITTGLLKLFYI